MTNKHLDKMFKDNEFNVRREEDGFWVHILTKDHQLKIRHNEKKEDLVFKVILFSLADYTNISHKSFLMFNTTLLNGAFAIDRDNMIFIDRIPTFDLSWGEAYRTILTADIICKNLNKYINKAVSDV